MAQAGRAAFRAQARGRALAAARELAVRDGWERVRMGEVARATGVSRPTLYKEFGDKQGLGDALVLEETERFPDGIETILTDTARDPLDAVSAAVAYTLEEAAASPLLHVTLAGPRAAAATTGVLALLPTSHALLDTASQRLRVWFAQRFPDVTDADAGDCIDAVVRLTVSHLVLPTVRPAESTRRITAVVARYADRPAGAAPGDR